MGNAIFTMLSNPSECKHYDRESTTRQRLVRCNCNTGLPQLLFSEATIGLCVSSHEGIQNVAEADLLEDGFSMEMESGRWSLEASGFRLSTRHVGADYANGMSLVQASDIFPDAFDVDGARGLASLLPRLRRARRPAVVRVEPAQPAAATKGGNTP